MGCGPENRGVYFGHGHRGLIGAETPAPALYPFTQMSNKNTPSIPLPVFVVPAQDIALEDLVEEIYLSDLIAELNPPPYVHVPRPYTGSIGWDE